MAERQMLIDSMFRDRGLYPNPANFTMSYGTRKQTTIYDPILDGAPYYSGVTGVGSTASTIVLDATASASNNRYQRMYVLMTGGAGVGLFRQITSYVGATLTATVSPSWAAPIAAGPAVGDAYEIYVGRDSFNPYEFRGELSQQIICHVLTLDHIVLPNVSALTQARYIMVEIAPENSKSSHRLLTNNPTGPHATFVFPIEDRTNTPFLTFKHTRAKQVLKFRPDDNIALRIYLDNGVTLDLSPGETYSPQAPNPLNQVSIYFTIQQAPILNTTTDRSNR